MSPGIGRILELFNGENKGRETYLDFLGIQIASDDPLVGLVELDILTTDAFQQFVG